MTLLELLVQELPKRGGWPEGAHFADGYSNTPGIHFWDKDGQRVDFDSLINAPIGLYSVTREQYEAAVKPPEWIDWNGGKCPVEQGTLVDVKYRDGEILCRIPANKPHPGMRDAQASFWRNEARENDIVAYRLSESEKRNGEGLPPVGTKVSFLYGTYGWIGGTIAAYDGNTAIVRHNDGYAGCSRSEIQTEAYRKREQAAENMLALIESQKHRYTENAYMLIYDAIAAHKISGVTTVPSVGEIMRTTESCSREDAQKIVDLLNGA